MKSDSPPPVFEVLFEGEQLYPEEIPLRTLSESLSAIQRLATGDMSIVEVIGEEDEEEGRDDPVRRQDAHSLP